MWLLWVPLYSPDLENGDFQKGEVMVPFSLNSGGTTRLMDICSSSNIVNIRKIFYQLMKNEME